MCKVAYAPLSGLAAYGYTGTVSWCVRIFDFETFLASEWAQ